MTVDPCGLPVNCERSLSEGNVVRGLIPVLFTGLVCLLPHLGIALAPVEVVALFRDRAVIRTGEGEALLRVGQTSEFGVTLLAADPHGAKVSYRGDTYELSLSTKIGAQFAQPTAQTVRLNEDSYGQYRVRGSINGQFVNFLVDTGASVVALSERHARNIGLPYVTQKRGSVQTAQGIADAFFLTLDEVTLGGITVRGVQATVIQGEYPVDVLLGMSFLNKVRMQNEDGVLILHARQ